MTEEIQMALDMAREAMDKGIKHMESELQKIRAGKAHPAMLDSVKVEYYGSMTPLSQVSNVNSADARTLIVQVWEKDMLDPVATAIINANLGLNPMNNGESILINIPPLTEERRRDLTKRARSEGEHARVSVRNARKEANDFIKAAKSDGLSEDLAKDGENEVQKLTDQFIKKIDEVLSAKEADIMTV
ncbi:ribosome recycling factor [Flavobacteriales bacterium]|nr:ribosome recycling factor [Flavobacteriales bacterium]